MLILATLQWTGFLKFYILCRLNQIISYANECNEARFYIFSSCFLQALKACKAHGSAVLATIPDAVANTFIKGKLSGNSWIGGNDSTKVINLKRKFNEV